MTSGGTILPGPGQPLRRASAALTHPGLVRTHNEDSLLADDRRGLWAVADGMGGHAGGAEASRIVVESLARVRTLWADPRALANDIIARLEEAHALIRGASAGGLSGSTVVCLAVHGVHALAVWCGDSRIYRHRPREPLHRVTRDHSVVQELIDAGRLDEADREQHPQAHVLTRAVGAMPLLGLDFGQLDIRPGDRFLLCSDGLTRPVPEAELAAALAGGLGPRALCERLVATVLERGGPDNVSLVIVDFT